MKSLGLKSSLWSWGCKSPGLKSPGMIIPRDEYSGVEKSRVKISCNLFDAPITSEIVGSKSANSMAPAIIMWNCKKVNLFERIFFK